MQNFGEIVFPSQVVEEPDLFYLLLDKMSEEERLEVFYRLAAVDFAFYCEFVHKGRYKHAKHTRYICSALEAVEQGIIKKMIVSLPPRHSKSMTISETFPSWFIGRKPWRKVIEGSYGMDLARKFGRANRRKIDEFGEPIFGVRLSPESTASNDWEINEHGGRMISSGIGGPITGEGADLLLIDDPIKNRQEADSIAYREMLWDEWENTLLSRLQPNGAVIIVATRWHTDDLCGRLLAREPGEWVEITLPALAEENDLLGRKVGEPLWPEYGFDKEWAEKRKKSVTSFVWSALYQQSPKDREGGMFRRESFEIVDRAPAEVNWVRYWDLAATEKRKDNNPCFTAGVLMGEKDGVYYIGDVRRIRGRPAQVENLIKGIAELDGRNVPIYMEQEGGSGGANTIDYYARKVLKGRIFYGDKVSGSKISRAEPFSAAVEHGNVVLVRGSWNKAFLDEAELFPTGEFKDQIDAASGAFSKLVDGKGFFIGRA